MDSEKIDSFLLGGDARKQVPFLSFVNITKQEFDHQKSGILGGVQIPR